MERGWKIWFGLLGAASLYGFVLAGEAQDAADLNEALASGAPQQTVVGLWHIRDLGFVIIYELALAAIVLASIGILLAGLGPKMGAAAATPSPRVDGISS